MTGGLPVRAALLPFILPVALTSVVLMPTLSAQARGQESTRQLEDLVTPLNPCELENTVAEELGGAVERALPGDCPPRRRLEHIKGRLRPPVTGTIVREFGERGRKGRPSLGMTIRTRPGVQVVAPFESTVMFAGEDKDYGQLLILAAGDGYHFILIGMTKIYGVEGQKLLEGEPVGHMDMAEETGHIDDHPRATGTSDALNTQAGPELYFEIRKYGKPIDPLPWLAAARLERTSR